MLSDVSGVRGQPLRRPVVVSIALPSPGAWAPSRLGRSEQGAERPARLQLGLEAGEHYRPALVRPGGVVRLEVLVGDGQANNVTDGFEVVGDAGVLAGVAGIGRRCPAVDEAS